MFKNIIILNVVVFFLFVQGQNFEYKDLYRAMAKAEKIAYRETSFSKAIAIFHDYMDPYVKSVNSSTRVKKLHRYGFIYSQLFEDCKNLNIQKRRDLEKSIDTSRERFFIEIAEFDRNARQIIIEEERQREIQSIINELNSEASIQESKYTEKKQRELESLEEELHFVDRKILKLTNRQQQLKEILGSLSDKIETLQKMDSSFAKLDHWWKQEKQKLAKQRFLSAEYVLNNKYNVFRYYLEHTGKRVTRIYYY